MSALSIGTEILRAPARLLNDVTPVARHTHIHTVAFTLQTYLSCGRDSTSRCLRVCVALWTRAEQQCVRKTAGVATISNLLYRSALRRRGRLLVRSA